MNRNDEIAREHGGSFFRISEIYWLALCHDGEALPERLCDTLIDDGAEIWRDAFGSELPEVCDGDETALAEQLVLERRNGLLARLDVQLPTSGTRKSWSNLGWGLYRSVWLYADTLEDLLALVLKRKEEILNEALAEIAKRPKRGGRS